MNNTSTFWFSTIWNIFTAECYANPNLYSYYAASAFGKKWIGGGCSDTSSLEQRQLAAVSTFKLSVEKMRLVNASLDSTVSEDSTLTEILSEARNFLSHICETRYDGHSYDLTDSCISWHISVGPGASIGASGGSWLDKFITSPLTVYPHQVSLYRYYFNGLSNTSLSLSERKRYLTYGNQTVASSKISFAPKSAKTERLIATEASLPMAFQLSIHEILSERLKQIGIDLANQQFKNRYLAQKGSLSRSLATIDLSSASDNVSLALVDLLFKDSCPCLHWWLMYLRSTSVTLPDGETIDDLPMLSTMGNGYTFVIETIIFLAIVVGVARVNGVILRWTGDDLNCGVYGDDIIVPVELYSQVVSTLQQCGFTPNVKKCFTGTSPFRESCGGDFLNGTNVRGVYLTSLDNDSEIYSALNRLILWSTISGINIPKTLSILRSRLKTNFLVPLSEEISSGLRVPSSSLPAGWTSIPIGPSLCKLLHISPLWSDAIVYRMLTQPAQRVFVYNNVKGTMSSRCGQPNGCPRSGAKRHYKRWLFL